MATDPPTGRWRTLLARPDLRRCDLQVVPEAPASDVLAMGGFTRRFEDATAAVAGRRQGVACSSGPAGLHLAFRALSLGEGDQVIATPFRFVASANCALYERAVPRFVAGREAVGVV